MYVLATHTGDRGVRVRRIAPDGIISHSAGSTTVLCGYGEVDACADGIPALTAPMGFPRYLAVRPDGSVMIVDLKNGVIWKVGPTGIRTLYAGRVTMYGRPYVVGDGGPALAADLGNVNQFAAGPDGAIYFSTSAGLVRRVSAEGIIDRKSVV